MGITVSHVKSISIADSTNTSIVRPSDWNSSHSVSMNLSNTDLIKWVNAGGNSISSGSLFFASSNNVSFGLTGSTVTASVVANPAISAAGSSQNAGTIVFSNSNGVSFGMNGSTVSASVTTGMAVSASGNAVTANSVIFSNSNNVSFGLTGSTVTASVVANPAISAAGSSQNVGTIVFSNSNGVSFGMNGSTITVSVTVASSAGAAISAAGSSQNAGTIVFSNSNNISFGMNGSTVTASCNDLDTSRNICFTGFDKPGNVSYTAYATTGTSSSRPWVAMPVSLQTSQAVSAFVITAGVSVTSYVTDDTNRGSLYLGIYSSSAGTLSTVWSSSLAFSHHVSGTSHSVSFGGGASSLSTTLAGTTTSVLFKCSMLLTLTLQSGTYYLGMQDQMICNEASLMHGVMSYPFTGLAGLLIGQSVSSQFSDEIGVITASAAGFPLTLTNQTGVMTVSKYPYALVK